MAQLICAYGLFASPFLWLLGTINSFMPGSVFGSDSLMIAGDVILWFVSEIVASVAVVMLFYGALQLHRGKQIGRTLMISGVWINLVWLVFHVFVIVMIVLAAVSISEFQQDTPMSEDAPFSGFTVSYWAACFAGFIFEIVSLIWLLSNKARLSLSA